MTIWFKEKYSFQYDCYRLVEAERGEWLHRSALQGPPIIKKCLKKHHWHLKLKFKPEKCEKVKHLNLRISQKNHPLSVNREVCGLSFKTKVPHLNSKFRIDLVLYVKVENNCHQQCVFDDIVIGLGTAGSLAANALSNKIYGDRHILGLEWGPNANQDPLVTTPFQFNPDSGTINLLTAVDAAGIAQVVQSGPEGDIGQDGRIRNRIGVMLGGSAGKNLLFAVHGTPEYHDDLAQNYTTGGWDNWKEMYQAIETYRGFSLDTQNDCRGDKGKIIVSQAPLPVVVFPPGVALSEEAGIPLLDDFNNCANTCVGKVGQQFLDFTMGPPQRSFGGTSYLGPDVMDQTTGKGLGNWHKLKVIVNSPVRRLLIDCKKRVIGVEVVKNNAEEIEYYYAKECVVSCAGAIYTPALLQRSGIGPEKVLENIGAPPVELNENVGAHYQDHYGPLIQFETSQDIPSALPVGFPDIDAQGTNVGGTRRGLQYQFVNGLGVDAGYAAAEDLIPGPGRNFFRLLAWNLRPQSRGSVEATSLDPAARVKFKFGAYSDPLSNDMDVSRQAIFLAQRVANNLNAKFGPGTYKIVYPKEEDIDPNDPLKLDGYIRGNPQVTDHPCSTCQFNDLDPTVAVTDSQLNVLGVEGLKVADLSVFPIIPDGNTCEPAYLAGVKVVEFITGIQFGKDKPI